MTLPILSRPARLLSLAIVLIGFAAPGSAQAQPKIATLDLKKIFDGYYKTKQADAILADSREDALKVERGMLDDYKKANDEYNKLIEGANDQAVSADEREKRRKSGETKLLEIKEIEKTIVQFRKERETAINEQKRRMRDGILEAIRKVINEKAKVRTYDLVLDTAAESAYNTPVILFSSRQNDLTDEVLSELNASAPPGSLTPEEKPKEEKPALTTPSAEREATTPSVATPAPSKPGKPGKPNRKP